MDLSPDLMYALSLSHHLITHFFDAIYWHKIAEKRLEKQNANNLMRCAAVYNPLAHYLNENDAAHKHTKQSHGYSKTNTKLSLSAA